MPDFSWTYQWAIDLYTAVSGFIIWIFSGGFLLAIVSWLLQFFPASGTGWSLSFSTWLSQLAVLVYYFFGYINLASYFVNVHLALLLLVPVLAVELIVKITQIWASILRLVPFAG